MTAASLIHSLKSAALSLQDAQTDYAGAVSAQAEAKHALESARAKLLCDGIDGKNVEQREAVLRLKLESEHEDLHKAEVALTEARCELDRARLDWDLARYTVRALEATAGSAVGATRQEVGA